MTTDILLAVNPDNPLIVGSLHKTEEEKARQLPDMAGYHILCAIPEMDDTYESGIAKADETRRYEELLTMVLFVVRVGRDAYADKQRFPSGPWCKEGDFVVVKPNAGWRTVIHGKEFRVIHDDSVVVTVQDPRGIRRA